MGERGPFPPALWCDGRPCGSCPPPCPGAPLPALPLPALLPWLPLPWFPLPWFPLRLDLILWF